MSKLFNNWEQKEEGFSLIEILIGLVVLLVMVIIFTQSIGFNYLSIFHTGERNRATVSAQNKLELISAMALQYETLTAMKEDLAENDEEYLEEFGDLNELGDTVGDGRRFTLEEAFNDIDGEEVEGYEVTVIVFYNNGTFHVRLISFIEGDIDS